MRGSTRSPVGILARHAGWTSLLLATVLAPPPAGAQYMYLDSNADGVHSAADVLPSGGTITVDVWLATDRNRDGSVATCAVGTDPLNIYSYEVCLRAVDGRVAFSNYANQMDNLALRIFAGGTATEFYAVQAGPYAEPPGLHKLCTLSVSVTMGAPSLQIVTDAPTLAQESPTPPQTAFGSHCSGVAFDNTLRLGESWFDADGLAPAPPSPEGAPILAPLADLALEAGAVGMQPLVATDPDADPITFSLESGPAFVDVTTADPGRGTAAGAVHAVPHLDDVGMHSATVAASDGTLIGRASLQVRVSAGANHPPLLGLPAVVRMVAGSTWRRIVVARDFDGQELSISKGSGPDFLSAGVLSQGEGGAVGYVRAAPSLCDAGEYDGAVLVGDGLSSVSAPIHVSIRPPAEAPPSDLVPLPTRAYPTGLAGGDLNGDGLMDLVVANEGEGWISVFVSRGGGQFENERTYFIADDPAALGSVALGDFNGDGRLDAAVGVRARDWVALFTGVGDGTFTPGPVLDTHNSPEALLAADLNDDGRVDLAVAHGGAPFVSVYLGSGDGTFSPRIDTRVPGSPYGLTAGDWNRDGRLDLAVAGAFFSPVSILLGHGDGTFRTPYGFDAGRSPFSLVPGDWDLDGSLDLAVVDYDGQLLVFRGDGAGGFERTAAFGGFNTPQSVTVGDLSGDGIDDLVVADLVGQAAQVFRGDGAGGFTEAERIALPHGAYQTAIGDTDGDAVPDLAMSDEFYGAVFVRRFAPAAEASGYARAFVTGGHRPVVSGASPPAWCARLEPVEESFALEQVDLTSVALTSTGTGSIDRVQAIQPKQGVIGDTDHNGIAELPVCFAGEDLSRLFDAVSGRREVHARLEGRLLSGRLFCTTMTLDVSGRGRPLEATVAPNPLNPRGVLRFATTRRGALTVSLYDPRGRRVRVLAATPDAPAGEQRIEIDGRTDAGTPLATGIYFFRIEAAEGAAQGRISVLK